MHVLNSGMFRLMVSWLIHVGKENELGKDVVEKRLEEKEDVFVDIYNNLLLKGKRLLNPNDLTAMSEMSYTKRADGSLRGGIRDIRKKAELGGLSD